MTEIMIDPNVRVSGGLTFSGYEDVRGPMPSRGQQVLVREPEANLVAIGTVDHIDENDRLIYIAVDWTQLAPDVLPKPDELLAALRPVSASQFSDRARVNDDAAALTA
jgi:hypothetical protein